MEAVRALDNHDLLRGKDMGLIVVRTLVLTGSDKDLSYSYTVHTNDKVPATSGDMFSNGLYA